MTTPGDTTMVTLPEVERVMKAERPRATLNLTSIYWRLAMDRSHVIQHIHEVGWCLFCAPTRKKKHWRWLPRLSCGLRTRSHDDGSRAIDVIRRLTRETGDRILIGPVQCSTRKRLALACWPVRSSS